MWSTETGETENFSLEISYVRLNLKKKHADQPLLLLLNTHEQFTQKSIRISHQNKLK